MEQETSEYCIIFSGESRTHKDIDSDRFDSVRFRQCSVSALPLSADTVVTGT